MKYPSQISLTIPSYLWLVKAHPGGFLSTMKKIMKWGIRNVVLPERIHGLKARLENHICGIVDGQTDGHLTSRKERMSLDWYRRQFFRILIVVLSFFTNAGPLYCEKDLSRRSTANRYLTTSEFFWGLFNPVQIRLTASGSKRPLFFLKLPII